MAIDEVVNWDPVTAENLAHHPTGPQGEKAIRISQSFRELEAAIARFNASPVFTGPMEIQGSLTVDGQINAPAGTTEIASLNIAEGVEKTTPVNGDVWLTADGQFNAQLNGRTVDLARGATLSNTWKFNTSTSAADPGSKNFSLNNATLGSVTAIYINSESDEKADANTVLGFLDTGHRLYIQQKDDADNVALFEVSGSTTDNTGWWTIPVTVVGSGTLYGSGKACGISLMF